MHSLTVKRNNVQTGKNCASYNEKHPENPIDMRPIYNARRRARKYATTTAGYAWLIAHFRKLSKLSKPAIQKRIFLVFAKAIGL